jgi:hypothetical protein
MTRTPRFTHCQMPAKKNGSLSARSNQRHSTAPFGVFLSGSALDRHHALAHGYLDGCRPAAFLASWRSFS